LRHRVAELDALKCAYGLLISIDDLLRRFFDRRTHSACPQPWPEPGADLAHAAGRDGACQTIDSLATASSGQWPL